MSEGVGGKFQESIWLKVLTQYCSQEVCGEFQQKLQDDQKVKLLKLLQRNVLSYHEKLLRNETNSDDEEGTGCQVYEIQ